MLTEITGPLLGGIGIFFAGAAMLGSNLKLMTTRRLRMLFARFTSRDWQSALLGLASGLITQSTSVAAFVVAGLSASGLMRVRNALPVVFWANAGCSILVIVAVMDIKYLVFLLLFVSGVSVAFEKPYGLRFLARALFGVGMLFFGLQLIRQGASPLAEMPWVRDVLASSHGSTLLAFALGGVMTVITQTALGVILIAMTMTKSGLFTVEQAFMLVYGVHIGSSVVTWILSAGLRGTSKQLVMAQALFNVLGTLLMVALFYVETLFGVPLVMAGVTFLSPVLDQQVAYLVVLFNFTVPVVSQLLYDPLERVLVRFWPPTSEEALAQIKFIKDHTLDVPEAALLLVEKELVRLVRRLPAYVARARQKAGLGGLDDAPGKVETLASYHAAFEAIGKEIGHILGGLSSRDLDGAASARLLRLLNMQELVTALEENVTAFCRAVAESAGPNASGVQRRFAQVLLESQEFLLLQTVDALAGGDPEDLALLAALTADSGGMVEKVRKQYLETETGLGFQDKARMHRNSTLFERSAWLVNRLGMALVSGGVGEAQPGGGV
ncbi:MAG: Na/Pi cotransporter family protein [Desulfovibrio sp.]